MIQADLHATKVRRSVNGAQGCHQWAATFGPLRPSFTSRNWLLEPQAFNVRLARIRTFAASSANVVRWRYLRIPEGGPDGKNPPEAERCTSDTLASGPRIYRMLRRMVSVTTAVTNAASAQASHCLTASSMEPPQSSATMQRVSEIRKKTSEADISGSPGDHFRDGASLTG